MNLGLFEKGSGFSAHWMTFMSVGFAGVALLTVAVAIIATLIYHLLDGTLKSAVSVFIWLIVVLFTVTFFFALILTM